MGNLVQVASGHIFSTDKIKLTPLFTLSVTHKPIVKFGEQVRELPAILTYEKHVEIKTVWQLDEDGEDGEVNMLVHESSLILDPETVNLEDHLRTVSGLAADTKAFQDIAKIREFHEKWQGLVFGQDEPTTAPDGTVQDASYWLGRVKTRAKRLHEAVAPLKLVKKYESEELNGLASLRIEAKNKGLNIGNDVLAHLIRPPILGIFDAMSSFTSSEESEPIDLPKLPEDAEEPVEATSEYDAEDAMENAE